LEADVISIENARLDLCEGHSDGYKWSCIPGSFAEFQALTGEFDSSQYAPPKRFF
jgi:hypothetical protein